MRLMVVGDVHGNSFARPTHAWCLLELGERTVLTCGDDAQDQLDPAVYGDAR